MVRPVLAPGPLREACGFYYQEFSNIKNIPLKNNPFEVDENIATDWMEFIIPETAKPVAYYDHRYFSQYPAITINEFGKGTLLYEGSIFSDEIQTKIIEEAIERAEIKDDNHQYEWPVVIKTGINENGKKVHFYYNYSSEDQEVVYQHSSGIELISNTSVEKGRSYNIYPWDILIVEEK